MAVRQYIGARYVPKYDGDWDATKNYEPLTIVTDANGNSFTSLKDVPEGTPLTDRSFWIQTSSFSGAVDSLQRRMSDAENDIDNLETSFNSVVNDLNNLNSKEILKKRHFLIVTDSYGYTMGNVTTPFTTPLCQELISAGAKNAESVYLRGGSFTRAATLYSAALMSYAGNKNNITDIIVVGGFNDAITDGATVDYSIDEGVRRFLEIARTNFPNALNHFAFVGRAARPRGTTDRYAIIATARAIRDAYNAYGADCYANTEYILTNAQLMQNDGVHPNNAGNRALSYHLLNAILTGQCSVKYFNQITPAKVTLESGVTINETLEGYETINDGVYSFKLNLNALRSDSSFSLGTPFKVGKVIGALTRDFSLIDGALAKHTSYVGKSDFTSQQYCAMSLILASSAVTDLDPDLMVRLLYSPPLANIGQFVIQNATAIIPSLLIG